MFIDLVESTQLSQLLDPEDLHDVLHDFHERCASVIARHDGYVAQYLGDGVLVYFGYPAAHEDDARRAVQAALEVVDAVSLVPAPQSAPPLRVRVGVHSGMAVIVPVRHENLAIGETPNLAARAQQTAAPNSVAVTDATKRLIEGFFVCEPLGKKVKGVRSAVDLYRVLAQTNAARPMDAAVALGLTPFVGRGAEVARLRHYFARTQTGTPLAVLVCGEAGIGKSRLVQVMKEETASNATRVVEWHCGPDLQNTALSPVVEWMTRQFNFESGDTDELRRNKLESGLAELLGPKLEAEAVRLLASLLSVPLSEPLEMPLQRMRRRTLETLVTLVRAQSAEKPFMLVIEDLHWADPSTLELIGLLLAGFDSESLLVVMTARPEFERPWQTDDCLEVLDLERLPPSDVARLIREAARGRELPVEVSNELTARSEGVPLIVEELTRGVLESGVLAERGDHYELDGPLERDSIPKSLRGSLTARLDRLALGKPLAQVGSVFGRSFTYRMIRAVEEISDDQLEHDLAVMVKADLLRVVGRQPDPRYVFKHALIREAAYDSMLKKQRKRLHGRVAKVLLEHFKDTAQQQPELLAHHFTEADDLAAAIPHWIAAGKQARDRSANREAVTHLTRGLEVLERLPEGPERHGAELTMRVMLGPALMALRGYAHPDVLESYTRAHQLVTRVEESREIFSILWGLWAQSFVGGQLFAARGPAEQVAKMAHATDPASARAKALREDQSPPHWIPPAHHALGFVECYTAHYAETVGLVTEAEAVFDLERERENIRQFEFSSALALKNMGATALWMLGKPDQARAMAAGSIPLAEQLAHPPSMAFAITASSWFLQLGGEAKQVSEVAAFVTRLSEEEGFDFWPPLVNVFGGWAKMEQGDISGGVQTMVESFAAYRAIGGGILRTHGFALLGEGLLKAGRTDEAIATVDEAIANAHASGEVHFEPELHRVKGLALLWKTEATGGPVEVAREAFEHALELARQQKAVWLELRAALSLARLLHRQGEALLARQVLGPVHSSIQEGHDTQEMRSAAALLADLAQ